MFSVEFLEEREIHWNKMDYQKLLIVLVLYLLHLCAGVAVEEEAKNALPSEVYRLPRSIFPEYYKLNVFTHINDDEGFKFIGDVSIKVIVIFDVNLSFFYIL